MTRKMITRTLMASVVSIGVAFAALNPTDTMQKVSGLFSLYSTDTFKILNGQDLGGTGSGTHGKALAPSQRADIAAIVDSADGDTFLFCVQDSKWTVYQPEPMKVGSDAMTMTDDEGKPFVQTIINALHEPSSGGKVSGITFTTKNNQTGKLEKCEVTAWSSRNLLGRPNNTGSKFFCGVKTPASPYKISAEAPRHHKRHKPTAEAASAKK